MSKQVTINSEVFLEIEATAKVSNCENTHDLKVTTRVCVAGEWIDVDITGALTENQKQQLCTDIEDEFRKSQKWGA